MRTASLLLNHARVRGGRGFGFAMHFQLLNLIFSGVWYWRQRRRQNFENNHSLTQTPVKTHGNSNFVDLSSSVLVDSLLHIQMMPCLNNLFLQLHVHYCEPALAILKMCFRSVSDSYQQFVANPLFIVCASVTSCWKWQSTGWNCRGGRLVRRNKGSNWDSRLIFERHRRDKRHYLNFSRF